MIHNLERIDFQSIQVNENIKDIHFFFKFEFNAKWQAGVLPSSDL